MQSVIRWGLSLSVIGYAVLHFITYFYPQPLAIRLLAISGIAILIFAIGVHSVKKMKLPIALFLIGIGILLINQLPVMQGVERGVLQMRNMIGLLIIIPIISWVLKEKPYIESIVTVAHDLLDTSRKFYFGMVAFTQIISYFLLFGSITMMYQVVNEVLKDKTGEAWEHFKGTAMLRGFALSALWVVSIPSFAFVIEVLDASLWKAIMQGLAVALIATGMAVLFSIREQKRFGVNITRGLRGEMEEILQQTSRRKNVSGDAREFFILFVSLFGSIFLLYEIFSLELLVLIPLTIVLWIIVIYFVAGKMKKLVQEARHYVKEDLQRQVYQLCVMLGAGMMIYALNQIGFAKLFVDQLYRLQEAVPFLNILFILPFIIILLGFVGLGPLTVMVLVGGILETMQLSYPPELIVLALTSGSAISILLSPLILPLIVLSGMNGMSGLKNGFGYNWKFAIALFVVVQIWVQSAALIVSH